MYGQAFVIYHVHKPFARGGESTQTALVVPEELNGIIANLRSYELLDGAK